MAEKVVVMRLRWMQPLLVVAVALLLVVNGVAQQRSKTGRVAGGAKSKDSAKSKTNRGRKAKPKKKRRPFKLTPAKEKTALAFVRKYHRELEELLVYLKENKKQAYKRAVRELWRSNERLTAIKKRSPKRYDLELKIWKLDSRSKVLAARYVMTQKESIAAQLRGVLKDRSELRRQIIKSERERLEKRLVRLKGQHDRVSKQLKKLEDNVESDVGRRFRFLTRQGKNKRRGARTRKVTTKKTNKTRKPKTRKPKKRQ